MSLVTFYTNNSLRYLVAIGQCFFFFPVTYSCKKSLYSVKFNWLSLKTVMAVILTVFSLMKAILYLKYVFIQERKFLLSSGVAFYFTVLIYKVLFINLARGWPKLTQKWEELDFCMNNYSHLDDYRPKLKIVGLTFFVLALVEHILFMVSSGLFTKGESLETSINLYLFAEFQFVFMVIPGSLYFAMFIQILNWLWTIIWNYTDVFLMSVCIPISFRISQIETKVKEMVKFKVTQMTDWKTVREDYVRITEFCGELEEYLSPIIIVSFANKLFVVIYQLMELIISTNEDVDSSDSTKGTLIDKTYFAYSFLYILLKLVCVTLFASVIEGKSKDIATHLFSVSSEAYNAEVERLITCIRVSSPVITGGKIFELKKCLLLKIASSIIVYELVLIKFQDS